MDPIDRATFLKLSAFGMAGAASPHRLFHWLTAEGVAGRDDGLLQQVIDHSDRAVTAYFDSLVRTEETRYYRTFSDAFAVYAASYSHPQSAHYQSPDLLRRMEAIVARLLEVQHPDGTMDAGGNRQSPPDTAFFLEKMLPAAAILDRAGAPAPLQEQLRAFLRRAGDAVRDGGIHTPNHRWVVAAVLAQLHVLFGDESYAERARAWLADGVYQNEDGNYPERSRNYALVENNAFVLLGRLLNRPELLEVVRKNLIATYYYLEPDGSLVTLDSRRQDQFTSLEMTRYYFLYKDLARHFNDPFLASVARQMEDFPGFDRHVLSKLFVFMEDPRFLEDLPPAPPPPADFVQTFPGSGLVRIRRGDTTASIFAGNDKPLQIASGRSNNPTFFTFRKGGAVLQYARLSTSFFSTGYVRGDGVMTDGSQYTLAERKEAYYYHPMPEGARDAAGDYALTESLDGRFWSKLDFERRPKDTLALDARITISEDQGAFAMEIAVDGPEDVQVTLELCFNSGGTLEGVSPATRADDFFLKEGTAAYTVGSDTITFGPGAYAHDSLRGMDGEVYSTHFGTIRGEGLHVYLTGLTPFRHRVTIR